MPSTSVSVTCPSCRQRESTLLPERTVASTRGDDPRLVGATVTCRSCGRAFECFYYD